MREGSAEVERSLWYHPQQKSPINFTLLLCLLPFCFKTTMTGVNIKACWAPLDSHPPTHLPTARDTPSLMHKHVTALFTGAAAHQRLPLDYTRGRNGRSFQRGLACPLTCHTSHPSAPEARQGNGPSPRPLVGRRVEPPLGEDVSHSLTPRCAQQLHAMPLRRPNWPRAAGGLILPPLKGQRIRMQNR